MRNKMRLMTLIVLCLSVLSLAGGVTAANTTSSTTGASNFTSDNITSTVTIQDNTSTTPDYNGNASSYVLHVGAIPDVLLDVYGATSYAWANDQQSPYAYGEGCPLVVRLLDGNLLSGLLNVTSTDDQGYVSGGLRPEDLPPLLQTLGLTVGALEGSANTTTHPPQASGGSSIASLKLDLLLINIITTGIIHSNSSVRPVNETLISSTNAGTADVISILNGLLEIYALDVNAIASANGQPGGASAKYNWTVADITLAGVSILSNLTANGVVELPGTLRIALGDKTEQASNDGTYAHASGDALRIDLLSLVPGSVVTLSLGHAEATAQVPQANADIGVAKNATSNGFQVTFTVTATNYGPNTAQNAYVNDTITCQGLTYQYISHNVSKGSYDPNTGIWTIGNLEPGQSETLNITVEVSGPGTITNTAEIRSDTPDSNLMNNRASISVTIAAADLTVDKVANQTVVNYLDTVRFTVTVENLGPDNAAGVVVNDLLPAGLEFVEATASQGTYDPSSGEWIVGDLANGAMATLDIIARVVASNTTIENLAKVSSSIYDHDTSNNQANVTINVPAEQPTQPGQPTIEQPTQPGQPAEFPERFGMPVTGVPLVYLIFAVLLIVAGLVREKKR